jgi:hypothetical protein
MQILLLTVTVLTLAVMGCRKQTAAIVPASPVAQPALTAWQQGDRAAAVSNFLAADWTAGPLFAPDAILSLTEAEFSGQVKPVRMPGFVLTGGIEAARVQMTKELATMKQLAAAVAQAGREAASTNDVGLARKHFTSLQRFAAALDTTNSLRILRLDAQAIRKRAETELATLPP